MATTVEGMGSGDPAAAGLAGHGRQLALVLALTVGLLGIREQWDGELVAPTLVVESIGTIVLVATAALVFRRRGASTTGSINSGSGDRT